MKRDAINPAQLSLIEPDAKQALSLLTHHAANVDRFVEAAATWEWCVCPGARDEALRQAEDAYQAWLVFAIFLDLERLA